MTKPLRLGILGCANIARQFAQQVAASPAVEVVAVASRDAAKAHDFAAAHRIAGWHGSYEALLDDPQVEAIYLPLPNSLHAEWAIAAAQSGKHVLCEKPLALDLAQATEMFAAAAEHGVMLLESYPYWFQPQTAAMLQLISDGAIGEPRSVQASFGFTLQKPEGNIRMSPTLGGGALLDAGSYALSLVRLVIQRRPERVLALSQWTESGVDLATQALLDYGDGRMAQISCAMNGANHRRAIIVGSQGTIETEYLNHTAAGPGDANGWQPSEMRVRRGIAANLPFERIRSPAGGGFRFAAEAFARVLRDGDHAAIGRARDASLDLAAMQQALAASARRGEWQKVG